MRTKQKTIRLVRFYGAWAWQKEEEWLNRMAHKGWLLTDMVFLVYVFRRAAPENWIYQLDYTEVRGEELEEYKQIFADAGWEYITSFSSWHYFRANADEAAVKPIHTNNESRIHMLQRVLRLLLVAGSPSFLWLMTVGPNLRASMGISQFSFYDGLVIFVALLVVIMVYAALRMIFEIRRLKEAANE